MTEREPGERELIPGKNDDSDELTGSPLDNESETTIEDQETEAEPASQPEAEEASPSNDGNGGVIHSVLAGIQNLVHPSGDSDEVTEAAPAGSSEQEVQSPQATEQPEPSGKERQDRKPAPPDPVEAVNNLTAQQGDLSRTVDRLKNDVSEIKDTVAQIQTAVQSSLEEIAAQLKSGTTTHDPPPDKESGKSRSASTRTRSKKQEDPKNMSLEDRTKDWLAEKIHEKAPNYTLDMLRNSPKAVLVQMARERGITDGPSASPSSPDSGSAHAAAQQPQPTTTLPGGKVVVPKIIGKTYQEAFNELQQVGLTLIVDETPQPSSDVPEGTFVSQSPSAFSAVSPGTIVHGPLSSGAPTTPQEVKKAEVAKRPASETQKSWWQRRRSDLKKKH